MKVFGIIGWQGSGKTTLIAQLLPRLRGHGLSVSTIKHAHHDFDISQSANDAFADRGAGAREMLVSSSTRWALLHENRSAGEPSLDDLVARMTPVDLLIVEGFKRHTHPKLEVHRPSIGKPLICIDDPGIVAIASDRKLMGPPVPVLDLSDVDAIADFIVEYCGLKGA